MRWGCRESFGNEGQLRGASLALDPERAVILMPRIEVQTPLPNPNAATLRSEAHTLLPVLELNIGDLDAATVRERFPILFEVFALEPGAANLLGKQPVLHRVIDVFQELAVDPLIDSS